VLTKVRVILLTAGKGEALQVAAIPLDAVILSEAKNPGSCSFNDLRRSFLRFTQDRLRVLRMTKTISSGLPVPSRRIVDR